MQTTMTLRHAILLSLLLIAFGSTADAALDYPITTATDVKQVELAHDDDTGHLFAGVLLSDSVEILMSRDTGKTWTKIGPSSQTFETLDIDLVVVDRVLYVCFIRAFDPQHVWIDRIDAETGIYVSAGPLTDEATGRRVDHGPLKEVALSGNNSTYRNRVYIGLLAENGDVPAYWIDPSEIRANLLGDGALEEGASSGLDVHYNAPQTLDSPFLVVSFLSPGVRFQTWGVVAEDDEDTWRSFRNLAFAAPSVVATRVSAYEDTIVVGYQEVVLLQGGFKPRVVYSISEDGGATWRDDQPLFVPASSEPGYRHFAIAMRGGSEVAAAAILDDTEDVVRSRLSPGPSVSAATWRDGPVASDHEVDAALPVALEWMNGSFGAAYVAQDGRAYFDNLSLFFEDGFESGDLTAWSVVIR